MDQPVTTNGEPAVISLGSSYAYRRDSDRKRVGIIGAGPAGLAALRRVAGANMQVECFEQNSTVGGIWNYHESTTPDETGTPLHSFIYKDLRTNLPKETMMFPDYPYPELPESYIHSDQVVDYLKQYTSHYDLEKYIKFRHKVVTLKPLSNCWSVKALDLSSQQEHNYVFDSVFVCTGPFATPVYPDIELAKFSGHQIHSKEFRVPEPYKDKTVLIIGLGPSGMDIAYILAPLAKQIYLSSNRGNVKIDIPDNVTIKPQVTTVEDKTIQFEDGSSAHIDSIIHCTGYTFSYPFLDHECEVTVDKFVFPLYKHFISIMRPTLFFIGLPRPISHLFMCDFQVKIAVKYLLGEISLPSEQEMREEWQRDIDKRKQKGQKSHNFHQIGTYSIDIGVERPEASFLHLENKLGRDSKEYFEELSELGKFESIPAVQIKMFTTAHMKSIADFANFRKYRYKIINENDFEMERID